MQSKILKALFKKKKKKKKKTVSLESSQNSNHNERSLRSKKDDSTDQIEQRIRDLILLTDGNGPKRWKQRKKDYLKKLERDNAELKNIIIDLQQQINAYQSQKNIVLDQLHYFQSCLEQAVPYLMQQNEPENTKSKE